MRSTLFVKGGEAVSGRRQFLEVHAMKKANAEVKATLIEEPESERSSGEMQL